MTILALDQSSKITGWSVFKGNELYKFGKFSLNDEKIGTRLVQFKIQILSLIEQYQPDYIVFEDIQLQSNIVNNVQTFKILAEVYGLLHVISEEAKIPYNPMPSVTWKSILDIKGKTRPEQKKNAQLYVLNNYNQKCTQDEADAICIGAAYIKDKACAF